MNVGATAAPGPAPAPRFTRIFSPPWSTSSSAMSDSAMSLKSILSSFKSTACPPLRSPDSPGNGPWSSRRAGLLDTFQVLPGPRVDLHEVPLVEEERDLNHGAGLQRGRLAAARRRVAADARVGPDDLQVHGDRQVDRQRLALVEDEAHRQGFAWPLRGVAHGGLVEEDLLVGL